MYSHFGNQYVSFTENWVSIYLKTQQYYLGIYVKDSQSYCKDICSTIFIAALFIRAITWKQLRCPLTEEWIRNTWCIYTTEYYSAVKNDDILKFVGE